MHILVVGIASQQAATTTTSDGDEEAKKEGVAYSCFIALHPIKSN